MPIMRRPGRHQPASPERSGDDPQVTDLVRALSAPAPTEDRGRRVRLIAQLSKALAASARAAGAGAVLSGQWLSDLVEQMAPHVTVRDLATLQDTYHLEGNALAEAVIRSASRSTAALGAAAGALAAAELAAPPALLATPVQLAAETLAVVAVELRMLGELHEIYGAPVEGTTTSKATDLLTTWVRRRALEGGAGSLLLGAAARRELRKRVMKRLGSSVTTLAPFLAGAVAGAEVNRRETRKLGDAVAKDLSVRALRTFPADRLIEGHAHEARVNGSDSSPT
ncbi:hypothetical protein acdb102_45710 [Acidothermaceae bacterium B102]|nr:hypothetical protein acdb102_45710 [Acidothermaceae bacterium B102]